MNDTSVNMRREPSPSPLSHTPQPIEPSGASRRSETPIELTSMSRPVSPGSARRSEFAQPHFSPAQLARRLETMTLRPLSPESSDDVFAAGDAAPSGHPVPAGDLPPTRHLLAGRASMGGSAVAGLLLGAAVEIGLRETASAEFGVELCCGLGGAIFAGITGVTAADVTPVGHVVQRIADAAAPIAALAGGGMFGAGARSLNAIAQFTKPLITVGAVTLVTAAVGRELSWRQPSRPPTGTQTVSAATGHSAGATAAGQV